MDVLILCWAFDSRWVFNKEFKLCLLWIPVVVDLITVIGFSMEKSRQGCSTRANIIILGLMMMGHMLVMGISYGKATRERHRDYDNKEQVYNFMLKYHIKKTIWSVIGLFIGTMSIILLLVECCQAIVQSNGTPLIKFRMGVDVGCWCYLGLMVSIFVLCKIFYLVWAWKFPLLYLRYRNVV